MPRFIQRLYPERIWAFSHEKASVFLTFDDGPIPEVTPWVLDELKKHNTKAKTTQTTKTHQTKKKKRKLKNN